MTVKSARNLRRSANPRWSPQPSTLDTLTGIPTAPVTAAHVIVTSPAGLLLVQVSTRGWDIPGGHVEAGEEPESAAIREVEEEAGVHLGCVTPVGHLLLTVPTPPHGYPYPAPQATQQIFAAHLAEPAILRSSLECEDAQWFTPSRAASLCAAAAWLPLVPYAFAVTRSTARV